MKTPFEKFSYEELLNSSIMLDANIFMIGIDQRNSNPDYSFERMEELILKPMVESFTMKEETREIVARFIALLTQYMQTWAAFVQETGK